MNQEDLEKRFRAAMAKQQVLTSEGLKAARIVFKQAKQEGIECALAGGIAMHVFGYIRATENVDLLASRQLSLPHEPQFRFGGERYSVQVGERKIPVNVIVRNDVLREFYEAALRDAEQMHDGLRVILPEWMVVLKFLARRSKDILDLLWMLREPGLVNRDRVTERIETVIGKMGAQAALCGLEHYYVQAEVMRAGDENGRQE